MVFRPRAPAPHSNSLPEERGQRRARALVWVVVGHSDAGCDLFVPEKLTLRSASEVVEG